MNDMSDEESDFASDSTFPSEAASEMLLAYKKQFIQFGLFIAFLVVLFSLVAVVSGLSYHADKAGLRECLSEALKEKGYEDFELADLYEIQNPFTVSASAYSVSGSHYSHAVIIRLTTMVGPVPAVFLYDSASAQADFICYLGLEKRVEQQLLDSTAFSLIDYWERRLPQILSITAEEEA